MKLNKLTTLLFTFLLICAPISAQEEWTKEKACNWLKNASFQKSVKPKVFSGIDAVEFAKQYQTNQALWDKAFAYLSNPQLDTISAGKYYLMGDSVYVSVTDNKPKEFEATKFEAHQKYIDIQYVAKGVEKMGIVPFAKTTIKDAFNDKKDVGFYDAPESDCRYYKATPDTFLIFFPSDAHRPNIKTDGCEADKKIVIKVLAAQPKIQVGLDNWFNRETNKKTGLPYHYLWTDTAWSGYSRWGKIFTDKGAAISTIERPTKELLSKVDVYIIVDPDTISENPNPNFIEKEDADAIEQWVKDGGVLIFLTNDAPNCEFVQLNQLASRFGLVFNKVTRHAVKDKNWDMGAFTTFPEHPLFKGLKKIYLKEISSLTLTSPAKPVLTENGEVFMAESSIGKGFVFAVGDPWIYNEYIDHDRLPTDFENRKAAENLTDYLISKTK